MLHDNNPSKCCSPQKNETLVQISEYSCATIFCSFLLLFCSIHTFCLPLVSRMSPIKLLACLNVFKETELSWLCFGLYYRLNSLIFHMIKILHQRSQHNESSLFGQSTLISILILSFLWNFYGLCIFHVVYYLVLGSTKDSIFP